MQIYQLSTRQCNKILAIMDSIRGYTNDMRRHLKKQVTLLSLFVLGFAQNVMCQEQNLKTITVRQIKIRQSPQFWAKPVAELSFGDEVTVELTTGDSSTLSPDSEWIEIRDQKGVTGFIPRSALGDKRVVFLDRGNQTIITESKGKNEIVLAGKGFNAEVEAEYVSTQKLSTSELDSLEQFTLYESSLGDFKSEGEL